MIDFGAIGLVQWELIMRIFEERAVTLNYINAYLMPYSGLGDGAVDYFQGNLSTLVLPYRASDIDGSRIQPGDVKLILNHTEHVEGTLLHPRTGDYWLPADWTARYDVVEAQMDFTGNIWIVQSRLSIAEDYGSVENDYATVREDHNMVSGFPGQPQFREDWETALVN